MNRLVVAAALLLVPVIVSAQDTGGGPPQNVRMRIGPLFVNPTIALNNAGRDTNVFNDSKDPKDDFTVTISPATDLWLRFGPTWFQSNIREDIVWFQKYASERSANNTYNLKWTVPLNRLTVTPMWVYSNSRERPGFEIDARAEHTETALGANVEFRLFTKTSVTAEGRRSTTAFVDTATFLGSNLHDQLNRTGLSGSVGLSHRITPLTTMSIAGTYAEDNFEFEPLRDSKARGIQGSIRFDPAALIKGTASFGYEDYKPSSPDVPGYKGSTFNIGLSYVLLGISKFSFGASRSTQYSFDINQPYYLLTGLTGSVGQQIFGPVDVVVRGGLERLEYRDRIGAVVAVANRIDHETSYGGGVGYHLGRDTRVGVNVDHSRRESAVDLRQFQGWTYGLAVTYATGQ